MVLKYHISPSALTEDFEIKIWEAQSDGVGAEVHTETVSAPHAAPVTITVNGLDKVVHIVRMYGVTSGNLLHEYNVEPTVDIATAYSPVWFKVGDGGTDTPAADQDTCITPELAGKTSDEFVINRNNYGMLKENIHYTYDGTTGTWILISPDQFQNGEEFTIILNPTVVQTPVNDSVVGKWFSDFVDISADTNYSNSHLRKLIRFSGSPKYTFQVTDNVPVGYGFAFQHFGTAGTATIQFQNGTLLWAGSPKASIDLPSYCEACFVWDGTNWNCVYMTQSTFVNAAGVPSAGTILGVGRYNVGDVIAGDPVYTIVHNLAISGDYLVMFSLESNTPTSYIRNNKVCGTWLHHATDKPNRFYVSLQEIAGETQDITIAWIIVKA